MARTKKEPTSHPDPITHEAGAHPAGVGAGAASGGMAGAAIGTLVGGPLGGVIGAAVGAVTGGLGGKAAAEAINPSVEEGYWRDNYQGRPWAKNELEYQHYQPALKYGWESRMLHGKRPWEEVEPELEKNWESRRAGSSLSWDQARHVTRDAWDRLEAWPHDQDEKIDVH